MNVTKKAVVAPWTAANPTQAAEIRRRPGVAGQHAKRIEYVRQVEQAREAERMARAAIHCTRGGANSRMAQRETAQAVMMAKAMRQPYATMSQLPRRAGDDATQRHAGLAQREQ